MIQMIITSLVLVLFIPTHTNKANLRKLYLYLSSFKKKNFTSVKKQGQKVVHKNVS